MAEANSLKQPRQLLIGGLESAQHYKILIVEDKQDNRLLLHKLLEILEGIEIREARNGQEAVELYKQWQPDFIWMDRRMPIMDGERATRIIRALPNGHKPIIVALTASAFDNEQQNLLAAGVNDFLAKPYSPESIYAMLKKHLKLEYRYERHPGSTSNEHTNSPTRLKKELASLSQSQKHRLLEAALLLNPEVFNAVVQELNNTALKTTLLQLSARLDYHQIIRALNESVEKPRDPNPR